MNFNDKIVVITGGTSGIGKTTATEFAKRGATVIALTVDCQEIAKKAIEEIGNSAEYLTCDVSKSDQVKDAIDYIVGKYGRIDCAFNNAGIGPDGVRMPYESLTEISEKHLTMVIQPAVELLAAIPSVIYGLLGMMVLNPAIYHLEQMIYKNDPSHQFTGGANLLSAIIVLAIMILPTVINMSVSALRAVPMHYRSASYALGATKIQTIFKVTIPAAKSGIMTGIVLGIGRALGEAMAINMVAGGSVNFPLPFNSVRFLTTQLVSEMSYASGVHRQVLFTIGL